MAASGSSSGQGTTEKLISQLLSQHPEGLTEGMLEEALPHVGVEERATAINSLLGKRAVQLFMQGDSVFYKPVSTQQAHQFRGLTPEDMLLYQTIQQANTKGIWTKDMQFRTGLQKHQVDKIIKTLEARRLIKAVKSIAGKSKKIYMLYDLEPSTEVTGGTWYTDSEFDAQLILAVRELCLRHVVSQGGDTLDGIVEAVRRAGAGGRDNLSLEDYRQVMNTLLFDNEVEVYSSTGTGKDAKFGPGAEVFRVCKSRAPEITALTAVPYGICPVAFECVDGGIVSPQTCVYFQKWLQF